MYTVSLTLLLEVSSLTLLNWSFSCRSWPFWVVLLGYIQKYVLLLFVYVLLYIWLVNSLGVSNIRNVFIYLCNLQAIIKKRPSRNINVQNFWLYIFGVIFNLVAICVQDYDAVMNKLVHMETIKLLCHLQYNLWMQNWLMISIAEAFSMGIHSSQFWWFWTMRWGTKH